MKVISGNFPCDELKLCYGKYAASVQQQPWQSYSFFPRNQVLYCYVTKVNNDSLNDPKKKNWRLAPLKGICTGKFDNVTNHSSKHYLKVFSLRRASREHAETTGLCGCTVTFTTRLCFSILKGWYRKCYMSKGQWEELEAVSQLVFSVPGMLCLRPALSLECLLQFYLSLAKYSKPNSFKTHSQPLC